MPEQPLAMPDIVPPAPVEEPSAETPDPVPQERTRPNVFALVAGVAGLGLAGVAQYLPWAELSLGAGGRPTFDPDLVDQSAAGRTVGVPMAYLTSSHVTVYLFTLALAVAAVAVVLSVTGPARRIATGAAAGLLGVNVLILLGLHPVILHLGSTTYAALMVDSKNVQTGPGYYLAYAAVLIFAAALVLATVRFPSRGRRRRTEEIEGGEPLELTVTPVVPAQYQ
ncbi:hypothetical protein AB0M46_23695 [Dactylosporangium sp. NPDC051485]|uniref:hypothetical protein n=1 Tax=Dactylosporangium sp. NPDC051485 TaxID=3154846 RepID=UPI003417D289